MRVNELVVLRNSTSVGLSNQLAEVLTVLQFVVTGLLQCSMGLAWLIIGPEHSR